MEDTLTAVLRETLRGIRSNRVWLEDVLLAEIERRGDDPKMVKRVIRRSKALEEQIKTLLSEQRVM